MSSKSSTSSNAHNGFFHPGDTGHGDACSGRSTPPETVVLKRPPVTTAVPLVTANCQSTTFVQQRLDGTANITYSRVANPTVEALEVTLGRLENAPQAVCFSSGLAAETTLFLTLLKQGDHVVLSEAIYGGTVRLFRDLLSGLGIEATFVDTTDLECVRQAIRPNTRLVFIETPANPTLVLADIAGIAEIAHEANALLAVDNTFLTPVLQQPLALGADISVYSTTKHIEGHSAALGGAIVAHDESLLERLRWTRKSTGTIQTPHNAWVTLQGVKTLPLRIRQHSRNALVVAQALARNPRVRTVNYPGLFSGARRDLAEQQHRGGHGGVVSFELVGGYPAACQLLRHVQLCTLVEHVGSVETLLTHPASMTHADVPHAQLNKVGLTPGLLRLSVGLEDPLDVIADLAHAIAEASNAEAEKGEPSCVSV